MAGTTFFTANSTAPFTITGVRADPFQGTPIAGQQMPFNFTFGDTYLLGEYIYLDREEARALRTTELTYSVQMHQLLSQIPTVPTSIARIPFRVPGMMRELFWVAQNQAVSNYNAWMLFTRDLRSPAMQAANGDREVWWPDAVARIHKPAFTTARSEPISEAIVKFKQMDRMIGSGDYFRSLIPSLYYRKAAFYNRYIYTATFTADPLSADPAGAANCDKIEEIEMQMTITPDRDGNPQSPIIYIYGTMLTVMKVFGGRAGFLW